MPLNVMSKAPNYCNTMSWTFKVPVQYVLHFQDILNISSKCLFTGDAKSQSISVFFFKFHAFDAKIWCSCISVRSSFIAANRWQKMFVQRSWQMDGLGWQMAAGWAADCCVSCIVVFYSILQSSGSGAALPSLGNLNCVISWASAWMACG